MATTASSLEHKTYVELNSLKHKVKKQLYKDIYKIYSETIFADIIFKVEDNVIKSHRCILQTRVPTFYDTYCNHPTLINTVPFKKLQIFIREIYCENEIKQKEEEILRCIGSIIEKKLFDNSSILNQNLGDSVRKQHIIAGLPALNALNRTYFSRHYFRSNSDNSVYYSLVDKSLVLSDCSDINEEAIPEMSDCNLDEESTIVQNVGKSEEVIKKIEEGIICKRDVSVNASPIVENVNISDVSKSSETKTKYFPDDSNVNIIGKKKGKFFKFFIDASDLTDENGSKADTVIPFSKTGSSQLSPYVLESQNVHQQTKSDKPTPNSLDDQLSDYSCKNAGELSLYSRLVDDFQEVSKTLLTQTSSTFIVEYHQSPCTEKQAQNLENNFSNVPVNIEEKTDHIWPSEEPVVDHSEDQPVFLHSTQNDSIQNCSKKLSMAVENQQIHTCIEPILFKSEKSLQHIEDLRVDSPKYRVLNEEFQIASYLNQSQPCNGNVTVQLSQNNDMLPVLFSHKSNSHSDTYIITGEQEESDISKTNTEPKIPSAELIINGAENFVIDAIKNFHSNSQALIDELEVDPYYTSADALSCFKSYLSEKYECAKKNHTYSDLEIKRLKMFDELLMNDTKFLFLKYNLEEILSSHTPSKTEVAMHKFLIKQYEKNHGTEKTFAFVKALMLDILQNRSDSQQLENIFSLVSDGSDVDDLLRKLLSLKSVNTKPNTTNSQESVRDSVTSSSKNCGFFIDLKDNASRPITDTKEKLLPSKRLFSMFVDIGNSTDSDSSMEVQNKFERRKKQYFSKMEKSRELRTSVSSLHDSDGSRKLSTAVHTTPLNCSIASAEKAINENFQSSNVVRRCKTSSPHPQSVRRSWNVDKTNEINQNTITKHKRSYSVSEDQSCNRKLSLDVVTDDINLNVEIVVNSEFRSIGNADSTNELTVNGESEISNSQSHSEQEPESKTVSSTSTSKTCPKSPHNSENNVDKLKKNFVKLSDLDKEPKKTTVSDPWPPMLRMTKSVTGTESNWLETKLLNDSINSRSLSRIFPDLSVSSRSKPGSELDDTTISSISSVQSSSAVSACESALDLINLEHKTNSSLGQDLLRMFLEEISTDVVVEVAGRRIKAHKCILTSRCQYFAALLSGGWVESAGNVLSIQGFSYNVVHFALCYIYSAETDIPDNINIVELATLADYLCLEGLKEVVSNTLKTKYCHFFHKPCNICAVGVLECLPVAVNYGLDDIHRKSLRWITKYYVRLWCTKAFASLPWELIDKCYNQRVVNMTIDNVFETLMNCDKLFSLIPQTRWAEPCFVVTKKLHDYCIKFLAGRFNQFLNSKAFASIASNRTWGIEIMDEKTKVISDKMRTDQLCQSYAHISELCKLQKESPNNEELIELIELLTRVKRQIETALVKCALQASQCSAWFQIDHELRKHILSSAGLTFIPSEERRRTEPLKSRYSVVTSSGSRAVDLQQVKSVINRQHKQNSNYRTNEVKEKRQSSHQKQTNIQMKSTALRQNGVQNKENKGYRNSTNSSKSPFRNKYSNVKSRYMDSKNDKSDKTASETTPSETSEVGKKPSLSKRASKSLVSSVHMSPAIRQTVRAVSLSKIPVSVRNPSQKRYESDRDTTSGSDNALKNDRGRTYSSGGGDGSRANRRSTTSTPIVKSGLTTRATQATTMYRNYASGSVRSRNNDEKPSKAPTKVGRSYTKTTQSTNAKTRSYTNGTAHLLRSENGLNQKRNSVGRFNDDAGVRAVRSNESSSEAKCPSNENSLSEEILKPDIPLRRDGTFCIDEPTVLKKHSPSSEQAEVV